MQRALRILGVSLSAAETQLLVSEIDANGDGEVGAARLLSMPLATAHAATACRHERGPGACRPPAPDGRALSPSTLSHVQISCDELLQYVLSLDGDDGDEEQGRVPSSGSGLLDCGRGPRCSAGREQAGPRLPKQR